MVMSLDWRPGGRGSIPGAGQIFFLFFFQNSLSFSNFFFNFLKIKVIFDRFFMKNAFEVDIDVLRAFSPIFRLGPLAAPRTVTQETRVRFPLGAPGFFQNPSAQRWNLTRFANKKLFGANQIIVCLAMRSLQKVEQ